MLKVENIDVYYGAIHALKGVSLEVKEGEIVTLIGANGAGKSTSLQTISGLIRQKRGKIMFSGRDISFSPAQEIVRMGISQVPEGRRIFANLSVRENLEMGAYLQKGKEGLKKTLEKVYEKFPRLRERLNQRAGTLSGGEQQMLAMGRALMAQPKLLLWMNLLWGWRPFWSKKSSIIKEINEAGTTILLVEQNAKMALSIANRAYVLETGRIVTSGPAQELAESEQIKKHTWEGKRRI